MRPLADIPSIIPAFEDNIDRLEECLAGVCDEEVMSITGIERCERRVPEPEGKYFRQGSTVSDERVVCRYAVGFPTGRVVHIDPDDLSKERGQILGIARPVDL